MFCQWLKLIPAKPTMLFRGPALLVLVLAAVACNGEATATPKPTPVQTKAPAATTKPTALPAPTPTPSPTGTPTPTPEPYDGATAFADYWKPPTDFYGEPVYGGTLRVSYDWPLEHANVWGAASGDTDMFRGPTGAALVMENPYDPGGPVIPDLARSWVIHDGSDGVTFHFRDGATWHNEEPFVCEDARFSLETMITGNGITFSYMQGRLSHVSIEETSCLDDMTLKIRFSSPSAIPLHALSNSRALIFNKDWFLEGGEDAMFIDVSMGIGPFQWAEGQLVGGHPVDGQRVGQGSESEAKQHFEKNPDYFIPELPYVDELLVYEFPDPEKQRAAHLANLTDWQWVSRMVEFRNRDIRDMELREGQDTWYWDFKEGQLQSYIDHDQVVTAVRPMRSAFRLWFNDRLPPFDNVRVRQAVVMGIDRRAFIQHLGDGRIFAGGFGYAPGSPWELPRKQLCSVPGWCVSKDMETIRAEAKAILKDESFDFGGDYVIFPVDLELHGAVNLLIQEQLRLIGVETDFDVPSMFRPINRTWYEVGAFLTQVSTVPADDPNAGAESFLNCDEGGLHSLPNLCNSRILTLLGDAQTELDSAERLGLAHEIELALMKQYNGFPLYWQLEAAAFWPEVRGYVHFPSSRGSLLKFMHMWIDPAHKNDVSNAGQTTGLPGGI